MHPPARHHPFTSAGASSVLLHCQAHQTLNPKPYTFSLSVFLPLLQTEPPRAHATARLHLRRVLAIAVAELEQRILAGELGGADAAADVAYALAALPQEACAPAARPLVCVCRAAPTDDIKRNTTTPDHASTTRTRRRAPPGIADDGTTMLHVLRMCTTYGVVPTTVVCY